MWENVVGVAGRMRRRRGICLLLFGGWLVAHAALAAADTPYRVDFAGIAAGPVLDTLKADSQLVALASRPPPSPAALRRRAEDDIARLAEAMRAEGYWQARVAYRLDTTQSPALATITVTPGPLFHIGKVAFVLTSGAPAALIEHMGAGAFGLAPGAPALSAPVAAANARIVATYGQSGYPFAAVRDRRVIVDVSTMTMAVTYTIDPGAIAHFGTTTITGLHRVNRDFITRRIAWKTGGLYDERQVAATRQALVRAGLFSAVRVEHDAAPAADGTVAMSIDLVEGAPRSIGAGVGYNTNLGFGTRAFWEHRNLFGEGEDLRLSAGAAQRELGVAGSFRRPDFLKPKLDLLADAELLHESTDAYRSRRWRVYTGLEDREFAPYAIGGGVSLERAYLTETSRDENYLLLGAPFYVRRDTTDDLLDPTKGTRATVTLTPYHGLLANDVTFFSTRVEGSAYQRLGDSDRYVLAGYAAVGSVVGASSRRPAGGQAALCRRRRLGQGLCLSACRAARFIGRADRRTVEPRIRRRVALSHHADHRHRALRRCRQRLPRHPAGPHEPLLQRGSGTALLHRDRSDSPRPGVSSSEAGG